ncbi:MAG: START domain-containing protein [Bacteroidota bacterium]
MRFSLSISFLILFLSLKINAQDNDGWVFKNEKEGVKVYYKSTSDIQEVKLISSIQSTMSGLIQLFSEVENYPKWGYKIIESRLLKKVSDTESYYYSKIDFPWPMNDRDIIMHSITVQDPVTRCITAVSVAVPDYIPVNKDVIRIRTANTKWTIYPGAGGWLYTEYYIHSDPGGTIPEWLVNLAIDMGPRETIKGIRNALKQNRYQQVKLGYIKE